MLAHLFAERAEVHRSRPAVCVGSDTYSYAALAAAAGQLSACLRRTAAAGPGVCILATRRSVTGFSAVLGALGAGLTYVPIDPAAPRGRAMAIAAATRPVAVVADYAGFRVAEMIARSSSRPLTIVLPEHHESRALRSALAPHHVCVSTDLQQWPPRFEPAIEDPASLAYILFTSGTTGEPKGVPIRRESVMRYIDSMASLYPLSPNDRCTQLFELGFDLSVHDMFVTWQAGACLYVPHNGRPLYAADLVERHKLTVWFSVPSVLSELARSRKLAAGALRSLRLAIFCGERLPIHLANAMRAAAPDAVLVNAYGPTEATIAFTHFPWDGADLSHLSQDLPIGNPLPEQRVFLLDASRQVVPTGSVGEVYLAGSQVTAGYWENEAETAARFHDVSPKGAAQERAYATGDLAIEVKGVGLVFRGRINEQVKLKGVRLELGGIEAAVRRAAPGQNAAALVWPSDYPTRLIVYVERGGTSAAEILKNCHEHMSAQERPHEIIEVERLPLTSNGKLDRQALAAMYAQRANEDWALPSRPARKSLTATLVEDAVYAALVRQGPSSAVKLPRPTRGEDLFNYTDSFGFVEMIADLEAQFGIAIDDWQSVTTLDSLVQHVMDTGGPSANASLSDERDVAVDSIAAREPQRGLRNVVLDYSSISEIDGTQGFLRYSGTSVERLQSARYHDIAFLLFFGRNPTDDERADALRLLRKGQSREEQMASLIDTIARSAVSPIRFMMSVMSLFQPTSAPPDGPHWSTALQLQGFVSAAIARHAAVARGAGTIHPQLEQSLPEWILRNVSDRVPSAVETAAVESLFVLLAECVTNPGTFAARIATSTDADYVSAAVAALAVFSGPKHGGATDDVMGMIADIADPARAVDWVRAARREKRPVPGFGHRVFQVPDPRAPLLVAPMTALTKAGVDGTPLRIIEAVSDAMAPLRRHGTHANVDAYTGALLRMLGVPQGYGTPLFALARMAGWAAHVEEQKRNNIMISPLIVWRPRLS